MDLDTGGDSKDSKFVTDSFVDISCSSITASDKKKIDLQTQHFSCETLSIFRRCMPSANRTDNAHVETTLCALFFSHVQWTRYQINLLFDESDSSQSFDRSTRSCRSRPETEGQVHSAWTVTSLETCSTSDSGNGVYD